MADLREVKTNGCDFFSCVAVNSNFRPAQQALGNDFDNLDLRCLINLHFPIFDNLLHSILFI